MRFPWNTLSSLLLSLVLAMVVWFISVSAANPFEEETLLGSVPVELGPPDPGLLIVSPDEAEVRLTVRGPQSELQSLTASQIRIYADLSGYDAGVQEVPLRWEFPPSVSAVQVTNIAPAPTVQVVLERRASREIRVRLQKEGEPAPGYDVGDERMAFSSATVTGPTSAVERVSELIATVSLNNLKANIDQAVPLTPIDSEGRRVDEVTVTPGTVQVQVPITQKVGFRDVAVKPVVIGQIARGYRVTNIIVTPPIITVSSSDRDKVTALPGFVETEPLDITGLSDDFTQSLALVLPEGVFPTGDRTVLVQITIAAIEGSIQVQRPVEVQNLPPGLVADLAPQTVDVLVSGPLPVLESLQSTDVRVVVNVGGLNAGTHQLTPEVILSRERLRVDVIQPGVVEVVMRRGTPPTRTLTPTITPTPTRTRIPFTPTPTPPLETPTPTPQQ